MRLNPTYMIDDANSDDEYLYIDIAGGASLCVKTTDEGIIVDLYPAQVADSSIATMGATWAEICRPPRNPDSEHRPPYETDPTLKAVIHKALLHLREHGPSVPYYGICYHLDAWKHARYNITVGMTLCLADGWPEHSGDESYPVPHPEMAADSAFDTADEDEMWDKTQPYGAARWRLVDYMIERTKP